MKLKNYTFEEVVKATGKNFTCERTISGYYRLMCDGEIILDDSACEDVQDEASAKDFFAFYLLHDEIPEDKKVLYGWIYQLKE